MPLLQDVRIIDKRFSQFDEKKSDPKKGQYTWIKKEYVDKRKFDKNKEWKLWLARYDVDSNLKQYWAWKAKLQFEPCVATDPSNPFVLDGGVVSSEGWWIFGDLVLVKMPLLDYLMMRERNMKISKKGGTSELMAFYEQTKAHGAALPDSIIDDLMGKEVDAEEIKRKTVKKLL